MNKKDVLKAYKTMKTIREYELEVEDAIKHKRGPFMGMMHTHMGSEAWVTAVMMNLNAEDYVSSTYRNHSHSIARGVDLGKLTAEISGRATGVCGGLAGNMHAVDQDLNMIAGFGIIGAGLPSANGAALASKYRGENNVSAVFFGDGALPQGVTHESLNLASLMKLPVLFCNDMNHYAMSTNSRNNLVHESTCEYAKAYKIPAKKVFGMSFFECYNVVQEAIESIKNGNGPFFIEFDNYRYSGQWVGDVQNYKPAEEVAYYKSLDPLKLFTEKVLKDGLMTQLELDTIDKEVNQEIQDALQFAFDSEFPTLQDMFKNTYADDYMGVK